MIALRMNGAASVTGIAVRIGAWLALVAGSSAALAQENAIESITANQQGANIVVNIAMKNAPARPPIGFSITNPSRIALDFGATANATGKTVQDVNLGDVRNINVVQAGERTRLVLNLKRPLNYATAIDGKSVILTVESSGGVAQAVDRAGVAVAAPAAAAPAAARAAARPRFPPRPERRRPRRGRPAEQPGRGRRAPGRQQGDRRFPQDRPA